MSGKHDIYVLQIKVQGTLYPVQIGYRILSGDHIGSCILSVQDRIQDRIQDPIFQIG